MVVAKRNLKRVSKQKAQKKISPVKTNITEFIKNVTPQMKNREICIGHALSNTYGWSIYGTREYEPCNISKDLFGIYDWILNYITSDSYEFQSIATSQIDDHATLLCMKRTSDSTINIWYMNPWGEKGDFRLIESLTRIVESKIEDDEEDYTSLYLALSTSRYDQIFRGEMLNLATQMRFIKYVSNLFPVNLPYTVPKFHLLNVMNAMGIYIKETFSPDVNINVIMDSMPHVGFQSFSDDGIFLTNTRFKQMKDSMRDIGACAVWSSLYTNWANALLTESDNTQDSLENIVQTLKSENFFTYKNREKGVAILGRFFYNEISNIINGIRTSSRFIPGLNFKSILEIVVPILKSIYDEMPIFENSVRGNRLAERYQKMIEARYQFYAWRVIAPDEILYKVSKGTPRQIQKFVEQLNKLFRDFLQACAFQNTLKMIPEFDIYTLHGMIKCFKSILIMTNCRYNIGKRPLMKNVDIKNQEFKLNYR